MSTNDQLQTLLLANSVFAMYSMMGFHVTMQGPSEAGIHRYVVNVFWDDDAERDLISFKSRGLLRDGDAYSETNQRDPGREWGWTTFEFFFE